MTWLARVDKGCSRTGVISGKAKKTAIDPLKRNNEGRLMSQRNYSKE
jgi:hypothetical protein